MWLKKWRRPPNSGNQHDADDAFKPQLSQKLKSWNGCGSGPEHLGHCLYKLSRLCHSTPKSHFICLQLWFSRLGRDQLGPLGAVVIWWLDYG